MYIVSRIKTWFILRRMDKQRQKIIARKLDQLIDNTFIDRCVKES